MGRVCAGYEDRAQGRNGTGYIGEVAEEEGGEGGWWGLKVVEGKGVYYGVWWGKRGRGKG